MENNQQKTFMLQEGFSWDYIQLDSKVEDILNIDMSLKILFPKHLYQQNIAAISTSISFGLERMIS